MTGNPDIPLGEINSKPTQDIREVSFSLPAIYADRFIVNCHSGAIRITLAEQTGNPDSMVLRSAFIMNHANAKELASLILKMAEQQENMVAGAVAAADSKGLVN